jgi:hypothetical protein
MSPFIILITEAMQDICSSENKKKEKKKGRKCDRVAGLVSAPNWWPVQDKETTEEDIN